MKKETSQWSKDVRKAVIDKDMTLKQLSGHLRERTACVHRFIWVR